MNRWRKKKVVLVSKINFFFFFFLYPNLRSELRLMKSFPNPETKSPPSYFSAARAYV
jgi:hypothetical protein